MPKNPSLDASGNDENAPAEPHVPFSSLTLGAATVDVINPSDESSTDEIDIEAEGQPEKAVSADSQLDEKFADDNSLQNPIDGPQPELQPIDGLAGESREPLKRKARDETDTNGEERGRKRRRVDPIKAEMRRQAREEKKQKEREEKMILKEQIKAHKLLMKAEVMELRRQMRMPSQRELRQRMKLAEEKAKAAQHLENTNPLSVTGWQVEEENSGPVEESPPQVPEATPVIGALVTSQGTSEVQAAAAVDAMPSISLVPRLDQPATSSSDQGPKDSSEAFVFNPIKKTMYKTGQPAKTASKSTTQTKSVSAQSKPSTISLSSQNPVKLPSDLISESRAVQPTVEASEYIRDLIANPNQPSPVRTRKRYSD